MTKTIAIASQKGGVGKTTTAVNLAAFLSHAGKRVLLLDVDPQGNAASGIGIDTPRPHNLCELLAEVRSWTECCSRSRMDSLFVFPAFSAPQEVTHLPDHCSTDQFARLHEGLLDVDPQFDFVVVDCPPSFGLLPHLALQLADSVLIPVQAEYFAMEGLSQILPLIEEIDSTRDRSLEIEGLLLTMFCDELALSHEVRDEVHRHFPDRTLRTVIPRDVSLAEASSHGQAICEYDLRSRGAWAYLNLAKEILAHEKTRTRPRFAHKEE